MKYLPDKMKLALTDDSINLEGLARKAGLSVNTLYKLINGSEPKANTLGLVASALGKSTSYFYDQDYSHTA
jgi:DNA-binding phage protein